MRKSLAANETLSIPADMALYINLGLLSGEVNYRVGGTTFNDLDDDKLNEDLRTDSIFVGNSQATVHIKAIQPSVLQYRRE